MLKAFRFAVAALWFSIACVISLAVFTARWGNRNNDRLFCRLVGLPMARLLGLRVEIAHLERIDASRPCVFVANHQTNFDLVIFSLVFPRNAVVLAKRSLARIPVFGWILVLGGNLLVDRSDRGDTMNAMRVADEAIRRDGTSIWFFPEGTRSKGGGLGPFKKGAFVCAARNGVPIVSVVASRIDGIDFNRWRAGSLRIEVLEPRPADEADLADLDGLMARVRADFEAAARRLDAT